MLWGASSARRAARVAVASAVKAAWSAAVQGEGPPVRPTPLTHDQLLGLFKGDAVGRGVVLDPATMDDMCAATMLQKPSLEVVYEGV